jgi:hypothetical protein
MLSNTKNWKKITSRSYYSPYISQGDIGFFNYKNKEYGQFICFVQTFSKKVAALPIKNLKSETLMLAIGQILKVKFN